MKTIRLLLAAHCLCFTASSASDMIPGRKQDHPIAIVGGTIHPVSGADIVGGTLLFDHGKITAIGTNVVLPPKTEKIDATGKHVYPGLINSNSSAGLIEIQAVRATRDIVETGRINPNVRTEISVNPESELLPTLRANGVAIAHVMPEGGIISGRSSAVLMDGWTQEDLVLRAPIGLVMNWPRMTLFRSPFVRQTEEEQKKERDRQLKELRDACADARAYLTAKKAEEAKGVPYHEVDMRWEAMIPVLEGRAPVFVRANEIQQIQAAVQWAKDEKVKLVIVGGRDSWRVADLLKANNVPVIVGPIHELPQRRWEAYDAPFTVPEKLFRAGVSFCIAAEGETMNERNLPYHAAVAAAFGLPRDEALKSITLNAARILGIDDRVGSLEEGKDATVIITSGDPMETPTRVEMEFIAGKKVDLRSRHTLLYEKYTEKYKQLGIVR